MGVVERLLTAGLVEVAGGDPGERGRAVLPDSYFAELGARFEGGFDPGRSVVADPAELTEPAGVLLVARLRGEPVGNGALRFHEGGWAEIKRMWVAGGARGLGVGRRSWPSWRPTRAAAV